MLQKARGPEQTAIDQAKPDTSLVSRERTGWKYTQQQFVFHYTKMNKPSVMMDTSLPTDV